MRKSLLMIGLLFLLTKPQLSMSEPIPSLEESYKMLTQKIVDSLQALSEQRAKITTFENDLQAALESSGVSKKEIAKLRRELLLALKEQSALEKTISGLKENSKRLSRLLMESEETLNQNEDAHLNALKEIRSTHKKELFKARVGGWLKLGGGVIAGTVLSYLALTLLSR